MKKLLKGIWEWMFPVVDVVEPAEAKIDISCSIYIEIYKSKKNKKWYWRAKSAGNHEILANSNQGYENEVDMIHTIMLLKQDFRCALIKKK